MSLIRINRDPSASDLRWFGLIALSVFGVIGAMLRWSGGFPQAAIAVWAVGACLAAIYYALRPLQIPLYRGWMWAVAPLGLVLSQVLLGTIYFGVLTPVALLLRAFGRDALALRLDPGAESYLTRIRTPADTERYFRQS